MNKRYLCQMGSSYAFPGDVQLGKDSECNLSHDIKRIELHGKASEPQIAQIVRHVIK